ncbi:cadherin-related tumor suppressor-like isoform X1 [Centruroides vittatus]|uniref:cadherin-related tumor suppressor-like isoform X1 n=1 Tax=Centruroides vittatus TaxID=120091 RepID=UPI003510BEAB
MKREDGVKQRGRDDWAGLHVVLSDCLSNPFSVVTSNALNGPVGQTRDRRFWCHAVSNRSEVIMTRFVAWKKRQKRWQPTILLISIVIWSMANGIAYDAEMRVQFEVREEEKAGILIGTIPVKRNFTYRFNENPAEFKLNGSTGQVTTAVVLDREGLSSDRFDLVVLSSQPTYPIEVRIIVLDINDNSPVFPELSIDIAFAENSNIGTRLILDTATDKDIGVNDVTTDYRIVSGNEEEMFRLLVTTNPSGETPYLHLETTGRLDREVKSFYVLNVSAKDGGVPARYGYLQVNINILDVNDNPPIFDHSDYSVNVNESTPPGTSILQVRATDIDILDNSKISYFLANDETEFAIDEQTGVITTNDYLHCKQNCPENERCSRSCVFAVIARDHGTPSQDGRAYVSVNLVDANDHDPIITLRYFPSSASYASVDENAQNGSLVAAISVIDLDEGKNGETTVNISDGNSLGHYRLETTSNFVIVRVNDVLDREKFSYYNLTITASDKGVPSRTSTAYLVIQINDVNDHEPVFETDIYIAEMDETAPIGSYVSSVRATDMDTGINSRLHYSIISGDDQKWFVINSNTGLITTRKQLDREITDMVQLKIAARDSGSNPRWTYSYLRVYLLDENDNVPTFARENIEISLRENTPPDQIMVVSASDNDLGANGTVSYHLDLTVDLMYPQTFSLDRKRGNLSTIISFDREHLSNYDIRIVAKDGGKPSLSSTVTIHLQILDVNDNYPYFLQRFYVFSANSNVPVGTEIGKVSAIDRDLESTIIYSLNDDENDSIIKVEKTTGIIRTTKNLANFKRKSQIFKILAKDVQNPEKPDIATLLLYIKTEKQNTSLEFTQKLGYHFQLEEDQKQENFLVKREVGKVSLVGSHSSVSYYITSGNKENWFQLDKETGILETAKSIDREIFSFFTLIIIACVGDEYVTTNVNITITDINDNHPTFVSLVRNIQIGEDSPIGHIVYIAEAKDPDNGENGTITYSLTSNPRNVFAINNVTGVVVVNITLMNEVDTVYDVAIIARDSGTLSLGASHHLTVKIKDVNNHVPHFAQRSYELSLSETTKVNTKIFRLSAIDDDLYDNGRITYFTTEQEKFGVFPDGNIYLKENLDREMRDYYEFVVIVKDHGIPPRSSQVSVVLSIEDDNDNPPKFKNSSLIYYVKENLPPDTVIGRLIAYDLDIEEHGDLIYSISTNQNDFVIDPKTGLLRTSKSFDREEMIESTGHDFILMEVVVQDKGNLKDVAKVCVYITDVNDNAPIFARNPYRIQLSETTPQGTQIIKINALDADEYNNGEVTYSILNTIPQTKFSIDQHSGQIILNEELDREMENFYSLTILAIDNGTDHRYTSTGTVSISVLDENDNYPEFINNTKEVTVREDMSVGSIIATFLAVDKDLNHDITYSLSSFNYRDVFKLNPMTGTLYLSHNLDREENEKYHLSITASDNGIPTLSTSITIFVIVTDVNDNPPVFSNTDVIYRVTENTEPNTKIALISAEDADADINGQVKYNISKCWPYKNHFGINPETGMIYTTRSLDREETDSYTLTVVCTDLAEPAISRLTTEKTITIIVDDINDNAPTFVSIDTGILLEGSSQGDVIMTLSAQDPDNEMNGTVTYHLEESQSDLFSLEPSTGILTLSRRVSKPLPIYNLTVRATDNGPRPFMKSSRLKVTILGVLKRQSGPVFSASEFSGSVYENQPIGTSVLAVKAQGNHISVNYYLTSINAKGLSYRKIFDVDRRTGIVSTTQVLESEGQFDVFELEIYAVEIIGSRSKTSKTKVTITVLDENDTPPTFIQDVYQVNITEDTSPGSTIIKVAAVDEDSVGSISYFLKGSDYFSVQLSDGVVTLLKKLDRENSSEYFLQLIASDGVREGYSTLIIQVMDINDNYPEFDNQVYSFDILENAQKGSVIGSVLASDKDVGDNSLITYSILTEWGKDVFNLNPLTGAFTLISTLDYEEEQLYIATIKAEDSGHPSLSSTVTIYINVVDVNDNVPLFESTTYRQEIFENITIGSYILQVTARDMDSGFNGKIRYELLEGDPKNEFSITSNGTIITSKDLDREKTSFYNLVISATDEAQYPNVPLSSKVLVTIVLKDVNDESPQFLTPTSAWVNENAPINTLIMTVKAIDNDDGPNSYIEYSIEGTDNTFSLSPVEGHLKLKSVLDRENISTYNIIIWAKDKGKRPRSSSIAITVNVNDINDNSPKFQKDRYEVSLPEDIRVGHFVFQVSASDPDEDKNGQIKYSIESGNINNHFTIDLYSGIIRVNKELDREKISQYLLTLRAIDCGDNILHDTVALAITITDINDNYPIFVDSPYQVRVLENMDYFPITIITLEAEDDDEDSAIRYSIQDGDKKIFSINATTGELTMHNSVDREKQNEYILTVIAIDGGSPLQTGTATVTIIVEDVNDNSPDFDQSQYIGYVEENLPPGKEIIQLSANDPDSGENGRIVYDFFDRNYSHLFSMDSETGLISTLKTLDREAMDVYKMSVIAQDCGFNVRHSSIVQLMIKVTDQNDNAPQFMINSSTVILPNNALKDQFVFESRAKDLDIGNNSKLTYDVSDSEIILIDQNTGVLKLKRDLNPNDDNHNITIKVKDNGKISLSDTYNLFIRLSPANRFPHFRSDRRQFRVLESVTDYHISTLSAVSPQGPHSRLRYVIGGGNINEVFAVNHRTGEVRVSGMLDREEVAKYELWIQAFDGDLASAVRLDIEIEDVNDNSPIFKENPYQSTISENLEESQRVIQVLAEDLDEKANGQISYKLIESANSSFRIDPHKGIIYTAVKLDREEKDSYNLIVQATDGGNPPKSSSTTVTVIVSDKNDNPPRFTRLFTSNVTENAPPGTVVIHLTSSDRDISINANATYSFVENWDGIFHLDPNNGNVTVLKKLDRETREEYILKVAAVDGSWRAETHLTITVQDVNDNPPVFSSAIYQFNISSTLTTGSKVGKVKAFDRDKQGPHSTITYNLKPTHNIFAIEPDTGEIYIRPQIHVKEFDDQYIFQVIATDHGRPPLSSQAVVAIKMVDRNFGPPIFVGNNSVYPVPENVHMNQTILQLTAKDSNDKCVNSEINYYIVGGNGSLYFCIDKYRGIVSVCEYFKKGAGTIFILEVSAFDRGLPPMSTNTSLKLIISEQNNSPPSFLSPSYQVVVAENEAVGSKLIGLTAIDKDKGINGKILYAMEAGNDEEKFQIDSLSGVVTIAGSLDYESVREYQLSVIARDQAFYSLNSSALLKVVITDINDNPPIFNNSELEVTIDENLPPNTIITVLSATDKDTGRHSIIHYYLEEKEYAKYFHLDRDTGVLTSLFELDYEQRNKYELLAKAKNPDSYLESEILITINICGINEFYPKFIQPVFRFAVSESSPVGTSVGTVLAIDDDGADDGMVYYILLGGNKNGQMSFGLDIKTGVVFLTRKLDRESQSNVTFNVLAKNLGSVRANNTDTCEVRIFIQDFNDPPVFSSSVYEVRISEDVSINTVVVRVSATDSDEHPQHNQFVFSIVSGNVGGAFQIDEMTGIVTVKLSLDREVTDKYLLIVTATDIGTPPQTGTTNVYIHLEDVNDNGPYLDEEELIGQVYEGEPIGTVVMTLNARDHDLPPNTFPYKYSLVGKDVKYFQIERTTGRLKTLVILDRAIISFVDLLLEIEDSGQPPMKSSYTLRILVLDRNNNPPIPRNMNIIVWWQENNFHHGVIANVRPFDPDTTGEYRCRLVGESLGFEIVSECNLNTFKVRNAVLNVSADDGVHSEVTSLIKVQFISFDNDTLSNSISIIWKNSTTDQFLEKNLEIFTKKLENIFKDSGKPIIFSITQKENDTEIQLSVRTAKGKYLLPKIVRDKTQDLNSSFDVEIGYDPCKENPCKNDGKCQNILFSEKRYSISSSPHLALATPFFQRKLQCYCLSSYSGFFCDDMVDPCAKSPCLHGGKCKANGSQYNCSCPNNYKGKICEFPDSRLCSSNPCLHGGTCEEVGSENYFCLCRSGYRGTHCESITDICRPNRCVNGGTCIVNKIGYTCQCIPRFFGRHCEKSTWGFYPFSYMEFPPIDISSIDLSITFATNQTNSLLIYSRTEDESFFVALEIVQNKLKLTYGSVRSHVVVISQRIVNDKKWHRVVANKFGKELWLGVVDCADHGSSCEECKFGNSSCSWFASIFFETINSASSALYLGGIPTLDTISANQRHFLSSNDYVGCLREFTVSGKTMDLAVPLSSQYVKSNCGRIDSCDDSSSCGAGIICQNKWFTKSCHCLENAIAPNCDEAFQPITLEDPGSYIELIPQEKYRRFQLDDDHKHYFSFHFRTMSIHGYLFYAQTKDGYSSLLIEKGKLLYVSNYVSNVKQVISSINLVDGQWHSISIQYDGNEHLSSINVSVDGLWKTVESSHNFLTTKLNKLTIGNEESSFIGCVKMIILNNEVQTDVLDSNFNYFEVKIRGSARKGFCSSLIYDRPLLATDPLNIGIILVIIFFAILIVSILISFLMYQYHSRKQAKEKISNQIKQQINPSRTEAPSQTESSNTQDSLNRNVRITQDLVPKTECSQRPDIISRDVLEKVSEENMKSEPYNSEHNSEKSATSLGYHYKGNREGAPRFTSSLQITQKTRRVVPGELSSNNQDFQASRVVSCCGSSDALKVAADARETQQCTKNIDLVNTLDTISSSSDDNPLVDKFGCYLTSSYQQDSTTDESGNDSFTCSEFEFDKNDVAPNDNEEVKNDVNKSFSKEQFTKITNSSDMRWENLLNWSPNYQNLIGVCKDIGQLHHSGISEDTTAADYV